MKHYPIFQKTVLAVAVSGLLTGCLGEQNTADSSNAVQSGGLNTNERVISSQKRYVAQAVDGVASCPNGGVEIKAGFDLNGNNTLDIEEVDQTSMICHGTNASGAVTAEVIAEGETDCRGVGGTKLTVGTNEPVLVCNAGAGDPIKDYVKAKEMVRGLGTWMSSLENYGQEVASSLDMQAQQLSTLTQMESVALSADAAGLVIESVVRMLDQQSLESDGSVDLATMWANMLPVGVSAITGSLNFSSATKTVTATGVTVTTATDTVMVALGSITLPAAMQGTSFELTLNNLSATTTGGKFVIPSGLAKVTTANSVDLNANTEQPTGPFTIELQLGSEMNPIELASISEDAAQQFSFKGLLATKLNFVQVGYAGVRQEDAITDLSNAYFSGKLSHNGQALAVDLGLEVKKAKVLDLSEFDNALSELKTSNILTNYFTLSATQRDDLISTYPFNNQYIFGGYYSPSSIYEYKYNVVGVGYSTVYKAYFDTNNDAVDDGVAIYFGERCSYYDVYGNCFYHGYSNNTKRFSSLSVNVDEDERIVRMLLVDSYDGSPSSYYGYGLNVADVNNIYGNLYVKGRVDELDLYGRITTPVTLPAVGQSSAFDFEVSDIRYPSYSNETFDNHNQYSLTAAIGLEGMKDQTGALLSDARLSVKADRTGYSSAMGNLEFKLEFDAKSFVANYKHYDPSRNNQYYSASMNESIGRDSPKGFSFTDANGGLITMAGFREMTNQYGSKFTLYDCNQYSFDVNRGISCALGSTQFDVMYNGVKHGRMWQDYYNGDWIVVYNDGTEEKIYSVQ